MPIIEMHLLQGRTREQKRAVAKAVCEAVTRTLGVKSEQVRLLITEHNSEEFSVGGITAGLRLENDAEQVASTSPA
ncbi:MAG: tautomerase family protein [Bacteroidota bacterium]